MLTHYISNRRTCFKRTGLHASSRRKFRLDSGRLEEAKIMFRNVVELRPESDTGYVNLAIAHSFLGELDQAEPLLRAALRIHPSAHAHSSLGFVYYSQKQYQEAAFEFENATELISDDALYFSNLGDAYRQLGRAEDAREAYVRSIELGEARLRVNALDREASAELSMALAGAGRCEESREQADYSTAGEPVSPAIHYYVAISYVLCGEPSRAESHIAAALEGGVDVTTSPELAELGDSSQVQPEVP